MREVVSGRMKKEERKKSERERVWGGTMGGNKKENALFLFLVKCFISYIFIPKN